MDTLSVAERDDSRVSKLGAVISLSENEEVCSALIAGRRCGALADALRLAESDDTRGNLSSAIDHLRL